MVKRLGENNKRSLHRVAYGIYSVRTSSRARYPGDVKTHAKVSAYNSSRVTFRPERESSLAPSRSKPRNFSGSTCPDSTVFPPGLPPVSLPPPPLPDTFTATRRIRRHISGRSLTKSSWKYPPLEGPVLMSSKPYRLSWRLKELRRLWRKYSGTISLKNLSGL